MEAPNDRLIRYLQDAHAAEVGIAEMLQKFIDDSESQDVARMLFREHLAVTRSQASRLEQRLLDLGARPSDSKGFFTSLLAKGTQVATIAQDEYDKSTQNLIKAYATEHFEQGMYASIIAYAESFGDEETAIMCEEILCEEEEAALKLFPLIEVSAQQTFEATANEPQIP